MVSRNCGSNRACPGILAPDRRKPLKFPDFWPLPDWTVILPFSLSKWWAILLGPLYSIAIILLNGDEDEDMIFAVGYLMHIISFIGVIAGLIVGLICGLAYGVFAGCAIMLIIGLVFGLIIGLKDGPTCGMLFGLICGVFWGIIFGMAFFIIIVQQGHDLSAVPINIIAHTLAHTLIHGFIIGLIAGLILGLITGLVAGLKCLFFGKAKTAI